MKNTVRGGRWRVEAAEEDAELAPLKHSFWTATKSGAQGGAVGAPLCTLPAASFGWARGCCGQPARSPASGRREQRESRRPHSTCLRREPPPLASHPGHSTPGERWLLHTTSFCTTNTGGCTEQAGAVGAAGTVGFRSEGLTETSSLPPPT